MAWLAITIVLLFAGYAWLSLYAGSNQNNNSQATVTKLQPGDSGTVVETSQINVEKVPEMSISKQNDQQRVQQYLEIEAMEQQILPLLDSADVFYENNQLVSPSGENAWENYQTILALDPNETIAISGLNKIKSKLIDNAEQAIEDGDTKAAESWIKQLDIIQDGNQLQVDLRNEVNVLVSAEEQKKEAEAKEKERQKSIATALKIAEESILNELIDYEESTKLFNNVLSLDAENIRAREGLIRLSDLKLDQAEQALRNQDIDQALLHYNKARDISSGNKRLGSLEIAINASLQQQKLTEEKAQQELLAKQEQQQFEVEQQELERIEREKIEQQKQSEKNSELAINQTDINTNTNSIVTTTQSDLLAQETASDSTNDTKLTAQNGSLEQGVRAYYAGDYLRSFEMLLPLANNKIPRAQFRLGVMYRFGRGVPANSAEAKRLFTAALPQLRDDAGQGIPWAQTDLGTAYEFGMAVEQSFKQAAFWYQQAADQNYPGAQTNLGVLYAQGEGVPKNRSTAVEWLRKAAAQGDRAAIENLNILGVSQ